MSAYLSRGLGLALRGVMALILLVRHPRPIHAHGAIFDGRLTLRPNPGSGIRGIDDPPAAEVPVVVRVSRSVGTPSWAPDVYGLGIRWVHGAEEVDLQLASTGIGVPGRFLLLPRLTPTRATFSSVVPYRTPRGPVMLGARTVPPRPLPGAVTELRKAVDDQPWQLRLYFASPGGLWHPFAEVRLDSARDADDASLRFDIDRRPLPGAETYPSVRALRGPSYRLTQG
ncbi:hypothetical protein [Microbacterium sp. Nx66]|uniref:hypothetical protein n=1 Tax=Microbacterium sp. Nx66 TaxID=2766784 RepID=UPI001656F65F|nr:hypothetical protein [Microbacterium sp. Nx66]